MNESANIKVPIVRPQWRSAPVEHRPKVRIKIDEAVFAVLKAQGWWFLWDDTDDYPTARRRCPTGTADEVRVLHDLVQEALVSMGNRPILSPGNHLHHQNRDRTDVRTHNLVVLPAGDHLRLHRRTRRRFGRRKRRFLMGFFKPRQPGRAFQLPELIGQTRPAFRTAKRAPRFYEGGLREADLVHERHLEAQLGALRRRLRHLERKTKIPRSAPKLDWFAPETRKLGLKPMRMALTPGEVALVLALIEQEHDVALAAASVGLPVEIVNTILGRTRVRVALERWRKYRRFPQPRPVPGVSRGGVR